MRDGMAETVEEAEAQTFTLPKFEHWREFALLLDGYKIAEEMGFTLFDWAYTQEEHFNRTHQWDLSILELRILLFSQCRADHMGGYTYHERDHWVESLLRMLSIQTGQPYGQEGQ